MRPVIIFIVLAFLATGCCCTRHRLDSETFLRREQELLDLPAKRQQAIFDLSGLLPANGPGAYQQEQLWNGHSR